MKVIFVVSKKNDSDRLQSFFDKTERVVQSKCKTDQLLKINPQNPTGAFDELCFVSEQHDSVPKNISANNSCYITNLDEFDAILNYFNLVIRPSSDKSALLITLRGFIKFNVKSVAGLSGILTTVTREPRSASIMFFIFHCLNFQEGTDPSTLVYIRWFISSINVTAFYQEFKQTFEYAADNIVFLQQYFKHEALITAVNEDKEVAIKEKCKLFFEAHLPELLPKLHPAQSLLPIQDTLVSLIVSIEKVANNIDLLNSHTKIRSLTVISNSTVPEEKIEIKIEWIYYLFKVCKEIEELDLSGNKIHTDTVLFINRQGLKRFTFDHATRVRYKPVIDKLSVAPSIEELLLCDYLYELSFDGEPFIQLRQWLEKRNNELLKNLIAQRSFLSMFFEIDSRGDSVFRRWANHKVGRYLISLAFEVEGFKSRFVHYYTFWRALTHVYCEKGVSTSALSGLCSEPDLTLLGDILDVVTGESIPAQYFVKIFIASIIPQESSPPAPRVIDLLRQKKGTIVETIVKRFRTLFIPPEYNKPEYWENYVDEPVVPPAQKEKIEPIVSLKKTISDEASLLLADGLFNRSRNKQACRSLLSELSKSDNQLFNALVSHELYFDVFFKHQQGSIFYYWLKWDFMIPLLERMLKNEVIKDKFLQHSDLLKALVSLSTSDNSSPIHLLFQKKQHNLLEYLKHSIIHFIQNEPCSFISLLLHPTRDKNDHPSCLLIDISNYSGHPDPLTMALFSELAQDTLITALRQLNVAIGRPCLVSHLSKLSVSYPDNRFVAELTTLNSDQLLGQLTQDKASFLALMEVRQENRKILADAFETTSFLLRWNGQVLTEQHVEDITACAQDIMFCQTQTKAQLLYVPGLLKAMLSHPQFAIKLEESRYKRLKISLNGPEERAEEKPTDCSIALTQVIREPARPKDEQIKKSSALQGTVSKHSAELEPLVGKVSKRKMKKHAATVAASSSVAGRSTHDEANLAAQSGADMLCELAMNVKSQKIVDIDATKTGPYYAVLLASQAGLLYDLFEERCFQRSELAESRLVPHFYKQARLLLLIHLIRAHFDIKTLSEPLAECLAVDDKTPEALIIRRVLSPLKTALNAS